MIEVDVSGMDGFSRKLLDRAAEAHAQMPVVFDEAVIEAREKLKPTWTAPIGIIPTPADAVAAAHMLYRRSASGRAPTRRILTRPKAFVRKPQAMRPHHPGHTGGRQGMSVDAAADIVCGTVELHLPEIARIITGS